MVGRGRSKWWARPASGWLAERAPASLPPLAAKAEARFPHHVALARIVTSHASAAASATPEQPLATNSKVPGPVVAARVEARAWVGYSVERLRTLRTAFAEW